MRASRIRPFELTTGAAGLALLTALFLPWYGEADAWAAFTVLDLLLALAAAAAIALPIVTASNAKTDVPITATVFTAFGGMIASLLVFVRLLDPVGEGGRRAGLYLGLAAALGIVFAARRALADEGT